MASNVEAGLSGEFGNVVSEDLSIMRSKGDRDVGKPGTHINVLTKIREQIAAHIGVRKFVAVFRSAQPKSHLKQGSWAW